MRRLWIGIIVMVGATAIGVASYRAHIAAGQRQREASYQASLQAFGRVLKPGMRRREVERYLLNEGKPVVRMCCMTPRRSKAFDVLTKIGEETASWHCSEHNVYVGFEFDAVEERASVGAAESDVLKEIRVYHWHQGCL